MGREGFTSPSRDNRRANQEEAESLPKTFATIQGSGRGDNVLRSTTPISHLSLRPTEELKLPERAPSLVTVEAAFFDLDKTVIAKPSIAAFGRPFYREGMIDRWLLLRALWGRMVFSLFGADEERLRRIRESALRVTKGWPREKVMRIVQDTLHEVIDPIVYSEALELIEEHKKAGRRVFLVSASPEEIVAPLARYLGVDEVIATKARVDEEGRYSGEVEFYAAGAAKAEAVRAAARRLGIDLARSWAYSDSFTDLPMLRAVGHPVAVNPDRPLAKWARRNRWPIRTFRNPVPLREKVPLPSRRLAGAFVVVVAGASLYHLWQTRRPGLRSTIAGRAGSRAGGTGAAALRIRTISAVRLRRPPESSSPRSRRRQQSTRERTVSSRMRH
ncbi:MAG: hypothetical protein KatS3mg008_1528 [Acidimicrobiales bacterium]|nr:MAG: hypothetical protein KatS3mg008_1528 [Acidimicrobiales bacterium]